MKNTHATYFGNRDSGISLIGDLPWGSHFCQFYQTAEDLFEILLPYLRAGLENNELCIWAAGGLLEVEDARKALRKAIPRLADYAQKGQIEILSSDQWHTGNGESGSAVLPMLDKAISNGFDGLRLARSVLPEGKGNRTSPWNEAAVICRHNVIAVSAYPRDKLDAARLMEVVKDHRFAVVKNAGRWEVIESSEAQIAKNALRRSEETLHSVFDNMSEGFAYHRIVLDDRGNPRDFVFLEVNEAFEGLTGLKRENIIGKRVTEVLPGMENDSIDWIATYGKVALTGEPSRFENFSQVLQRSYAVSAFSPHKGYFAVVFTDITERRQAEETMQDANERLQEQAEELQTQTEELRAQAEELASANEGLRRSQRERETAVEFLRLINDSVATADLVEAAVDFFQQQSGCEAVAIRLKEGDDYPYYRTRGFSPEFVQMETCLCAKGPAGRLLLDEAGDPVVECLCGTVIREQFDPSKPFFTSGGSFWTNSTTRLLTDKAEVNCRARIRNQCNREGYESVALVPLRFGEERMGLLQLNDRRKGLFTPEGIALWERLAGYLGVALAKCKTDQALREAHQRAAWLARFPDENPNPVARITADGNVLYHNPAAATASGWCCRTGQSLPQSLLPLVEQAMAQNQVTQQDVPLGERFYSVSVAPFLRESYANIYGRDVTERRQAEEALRDSEQRLSRAQEIAHLGSWELDLRNDRLTWSDEIYRIFGLQPQEFSATYEAFLDAIHPEDRAAVDAAYAGSLREGKSSYEIEHRIVRRATGEVRWVHEKCQHITDAAGRIVRSIGMVLDITERRCAEQAIRDSEQRLRLALEGGRMGRWEIDLQGDSGFWDERAYELLGLDTSVPPTNAAFLARVDRRDRDALQELFTKTVAGREDLQAEFRAVHSNGEVLWLSSRGKVICDNAGRAVRVLGVLYDITQRKQMEDQLRRLNDELEEEVQAQTEELRDTVDRLQGEVARRVGAEGRLRKHSQMLEGFFQHTITPLAFMDRDFNFVRVNEAYAVADDKVPEYFVGRNHFALYPSDENQAIFEQVVRTRQLYRAYAEPFAYPDATRRGTTFWNWQLTPLLDEHGEVQFLVLNLENVTERQRAFHELERRARQLQQLTLELSQAEDRERRRLAEILHDDLQQQLAAAKFHLGILGGRIKNHPSVRDMVGQLDQILKDAIEKSRNLSHELSPAVLYHSDLGETFEWLARQLHVKHGLTVHVDAVDQVHLQSEALKTFLYKAAQEILFNIVKHARVKEARLRLKRLRGRLWLTIADRGQGFDPQTVERTGGFGLFSIRERIELLGGRMRVRSAVGRGSIFVIVLPDGQMMEDRRQRTEDGLVPSAAVRHPPSGPRLRVLLADDHKVMREGLAALLNEQADMEVVAQAGNGREAVNLTCEFQPDVVIMDISMPLMAGDEATRQIKLHMPKTRVIALSMFEEDGVAETVCKAGAERYLLKTAPFDELLGAIRGKRS